MTKHAQSNPSLPDTLQAFFEGNTPSLNSAVKAYNAWLGNVREVQDESVRYMKTVMTTNLKAATDLAACKSPTEVLDLQIQYAGTAFSVFMDETRKMVEICNQLAESTLQK